MSFRILSERGQSLARSNITSIRRLASAANTAASKKQFPEPLFPSGLHKRSELIGEVAKGKNVQSSTTTKKPTLFPNIEKKSKDDKTKSHKEDMSTAPIEQRNIDSGNPVSNRPPKDQASGASPSLNDSLTWSEFFRLRRRLQLIQRFGGIPFTFAFWAVEGVILSLPIFDPTKTIMQLDPMVIVGLVTVAGSVASYAIGVSLTGLAWRMIRSNLAKQLDNKQKDFYARITKHRANVPPNPTQMNFSFDYYGEKVRSVADYRTWLRRQHKLLADRQFPVQ